MAEDQKSTTAKTVTFTESETKFLQCLFRNIEGTIHFNYNAAAAELGFKDGSVVRTRWNTINRNKIQASGANPPGGVQKTRTPSKQTSKKAKTDDVDGDAMKTPTKRGRKPKSTVQQDIKVEEDGEAVDGFEDEDEEDI